MKKSLLVLLLSLLASACNTPSPKVIRVATNHSIMANPEGKLVSPGDYEKELPSDGDKGQGAYMDNILEHLDTYVESSSSKPVKVLIYIHGGLNLSENSILRTGCLTEAIMMDKDHHNLRCNESNYEPNEEPTTLAVEGHFPIFINWRSFLFSTYGEHVLSTRQGEKWPLLGGWASSPFVFLGDVGRAVSRAPMVWIHEMNTTLSSIRGTVFLKVRPAVFEHYSELKRKVETEGKNQIHLSIGEDCGPPVFSPPNFTQVKDPNELSGGKSYDGRAPGGSLFEGSVVTAMYWLTLPTKLLSGPAIDSFGKPAWDIMNRRTELLRHQPQDYVKAGPNRTGAVAKFLDVLVKKFPKPKDSNVPKIEVTIIGHSMGAIVANWIVADYGDKLNLKNIVYMAAATKMSDFERQVIPYLVSESGTQTEFYNLTLHPRQEVRERNVLDLSPRGSLLVWIDNYLSNPEDFLDRTLGRWDNIIVASHIFPEKIRGRVHIKAFGVKEWSKDKSKKNPQNHGDFPNSIFWKEKFWEPVVKKPGEEICDEGA